MQREEFPLAAGASSVKPWQLELAKHDGDTAESTVRWHGNPSGMGQGSRHFVSISAPHAELGCL